MLNLIAFRFSFSLPIHQKPERTCKDNFIKGGNARCMHDYEKSFMYTSTGMLTFLFFLNNSLFCSRRPRNQEQRMIWLSFYKENTPRIRSPSLREWIEDFQWRRIILAPRGSQRGGRILSD